MQLSCFNQSVDFLKAFDRVNYEALFKIMGYFNFWSTCISWIKLLFHDFVLQMTNNGYLSNEIRPTRGLFQGNPISSYLFLLVAEILAIQLRSHPQIEGVNVRGIKALLSQFADDLDLFLKFKESVWNAVMSVFDKFESLSGMKISYEKTTIYRIGSLRDSNARFYSARKIKWTNEPLNVLGVTVCNGKNECMELNLDPLIKKAKNLLQIWKMRGLSLIG